jgi:hypothetical protein
MNKPTIDEILAPQPEARPRIYAYATGEGVTVETIVEHLLARK